MLPTTCIFTSSLVLIVADVTWQPNHARSKHLSSMEIHNFKRLFVQ